MTDLAGLVNSSAVYVARSELARSTVRPPEGMEVGDRAMFYAEVADRLASALGGLLAEIDETSKPK